MQTHSSLDDHCQYAIGDAQRSAQTGDWQTAAAHLQHATEASPNNAQLWFDYGIALQNLGNAEAAAQAFDRAVCLKPAWSLAWLHLARCLWPIDQDLCEQVYRRLLQEIDVNVAGADTIQTIAAQELSTILMTLGQFPEAWHAFEWRFAQQGRTATWPNTEAPVWDGRELDNDIVMVWAEQGLGDHLQFSRFAKHIHEKGGRVWLQTPAVLQELYLDLPHLDRLVDMGEAPSGFDWQIPLMSIPGKLGLTLDCVHNGQAYLQASPKNKHIAQQCLTRYDQQGKTKIGFLWASCADNPASAHRDIDVTLLAEMADQRTQEQWFCLQFNHHQKELSRYSNIIDVSNDIGNFARTAAFVSSMDLIVTVDTAMSHLAGALGKECITLLDASADWRWLQNTSDSPWYHRHTLIRQQQQGEWANVLAQLETQLNTRTWS